MATAAWGTSMLSRHPVPGCVPALSECGRNTHCTQEGVTDRWVGVLPTDLSGQHPLSYVGGGQGRFQKHCSCPQHSAVARGVETAVNQEAAAWQLLGHPGGLSFSGPPSRARTGGISLGLAAALPPPSLPRSSGSSSGQGRRGWPGPRAWGTGWPARPGCMLTVQSSPRQGVEDAAR